MKKYIAKVGEKLVANKTYEIDNTVKAISVDRMKVRQWVAKHDKFGDCVIFPVIIHDNKTMELTEW